MDAIMKEVKHLNRYWVDRSVFNILCYVDDVVLAAKNGDILQRLVFNYN